MQEKRAELLKNRDELERLTKQRSAVVSGAGKPANHKGESVDSLIAAVVDNVMQLNNDIDQLDQQVAGVRNGMSKLDSLRRKAQEEVNGTVDSCEEAPELAKKLATTFMKAAHLHRKQLKAVEDLERTRKRQRKRSRQVSHLHTRTHTCTPL